MKFHCDLWWFNGDCWSVQSEHGLDVRSRCQEDYAKRAQWVQTALDNFLVMQGDETVHEWWHQGMPCGLPGTDLINWVLNWTYDCVADATVYHLIGRLIIAVTTRQGDDVWTKVRSLVESIGGYAAWTSLNVEGQPSKQLFSGKTGDRPHEVFVEFLRFLFGPSNSDEWTLGVCNPSGLDGKFHVLNTSGWCACSQWNPHDCCCQTQSDHKLALHGVSLPPCHIWCANGTVNSSMVIWHMMW